MGASTSTSAAQNDRRRLGQHSLTESLDTKGVHAKPFQPLAMLFELGSRLSALHRDECSARTQECQRPRPQPIERSDSTRNNHVEQWAPVILGSLAQNRCVRQAQSVDDLAQEVRSTQHRLDQRERDVCPKYGQHNAG